MYDLSSKFNSFYNSYVVLSQDEQTKLHEKKDLNIQRLKDGLKEYNEDYRTSYSVIDYYVQGSVSMSTVVQNEDSDYDIDVAIVFDADDLDNIGPQAMRNVVANALRRKTKQFNAEPEVKTSCVRIKYSDGYHIDFAIYRRSYDYWTRCYKYEHAGSEWQERELKGLSEWFKTQNDNSNGKLRKVVRLSKMFCKSRDFWKNMPSGLLQTVLCDERLYVSYDRIDELFYYTMQEIVTRLEQFTSVTAPVDNGRNLTPRKSDLKRMTNWKNRLKSKLEDLDILFDRNCTETDAVQAWYGFFNHDFWKEQKRNLISYSYKPVIESIRSFADEEQFIEDLYPVKLQYQCNISCTVRCNGWRDTPLTQFLPNFEHFIPHNCRIYCEMKDTNCLPPYKILWKGRNVGPEAERRNMVRGQILDRGKKIEEPTNFYGKHYIECYIIKDNECVARKRISIPIGRK